MARTCTVCGKRAYSDYCVQHKPRVPIKTASCTECGSAYHTKALCPALRKTLRPTGKEAANWYKFKVQWMQDHQGQSMHCHYCGRLLTPEEITLDHKIPRSRSPELRYDRSNIVPCCWTCNGLKGSIEHDKYVHTCH